MQQAGDITGLLHEWRQGKNPAAENQLFDLVIPDLMRLARYLMKGERKNHSLEPTDLVDQVYLRLVAAKNQDWQNRHHFYAIAARTMRRYLIDYARARPGAEFIQLEGLENLIPANRSKLDTALMIDNLLNEMAKSHPEWCNLVELKYFLGLTDDEVADVLGVPLRTMQRKWHEARLWLFERLSTGGGRSDGAASGSLQ
jgi:RNA polymerase sigma-70 factor, ECF subfamily